MKINYIETDTLPKFLFIYKIPGSTGYEVIGKKLDDPNSRFKLLFQGYDYQYNIIGNLGDTVFVNTNNGADNFRVVAIDFEHAAKENWKDIIPERKQKLDYASMIGRRIIAGYLVNATSAIYQYTSEGKLMFSPKLPGLGTAGGFGGFQDDPYVFYDYTSFTAPPCIYTIFLGKNPYPSMIVIK